ncbi:MAG: DDE-type integrase/transposase/recombinase [Mycoplasmataceae bacterium]|jgi:hypothetical protein|nr:DDE-type integrase/transposase/recombinase [Mycoplasmataceae bacterium]
MKEKKNQMSIFKYGLIAPIFTKTMTEETIKKYWENHIMKGVVNPFGKTVFFSYSTITSWLSNYRRNGLEGITWKKRSDTGRYRKFNAEVIKGIDTILEKYPRLPAIRIYDKLIEENIIGIKQISIRTITRYCKQFKLNKNTEPTKDFKRYESALINDYWHGDTSDGPYLYLDGKKIKLHVIALIDDASRYIVGCDIFVSDNIVNLFTVIKQAVSGYGVPIHLKFDNGSNYKSEQIVFLGARLGTNIQYCPVRTPTSKAKIERWFKTLHEQWQCTIDYKTFKSLDAYRISLQTYVNKYNNSIHSSLDKETPFQRYFSQASAIRRISNEEIEKDFLFEKKRKSSADGIIYLDSMIYEVPIIYSRRIITIKYTHDYEKVYLVKEDNELLLINKLDKIANQSTKRAYKLKMEETESE